MATLTSDTDIVFLVDTSGSMGDEITKVKNALNNFADSLTDENVTFRLGLIDFGYSSNDSSTQYIKSHGFFEDVETFKNEISTLNDYGGYEYGLTAIRTALEMDFREGATVRFIMLTDEGYEENNNSSYSDTYIQADSATSLLNTAGVVLDVVGKMDSSYGYSNSCQNEYTPIANATGGNFYDIDSLDYTTILNDIVQEIVNQNDTVMVNLNDVGESETGVFVVSFASDSATTTSTVATFKTSADASDTVVGNVTADKVYTAAADSEYRQNITIPENWNVTGTNNNDALYVTGNGISVGGGAGNDRFYLSSGVTDTNLVDFTPSEDYLSFGTTIPENSLKKSLLESMLCLSSDDIQLTFQNMTSVTSELLNKSVNNGGITNTIGQLLEGYASNFINPTEPVVMSLSRWSYGFNPEEN